MFREARRHELGPLLRLLRQLHQDDPDLNIERAEEVFERILETDGLHLFVLEHDGMIIATTYLNVIPNLTRSASPYAVIENVVVDEGVRNRGLGKRLMAETLQAAWDAGCYKAMLLTGSKREETHAFYRACGFSGDAKAGFVVRRG